MSETDNIQPFTTVEDAGDVISAGITTPVRVQCQIITTNPTEGDVYCDNSSHLRICSRCKQYFCSTHASPVSPLHYCVDCLPPVPKVVIEENFIRSDKVEDWNEEADEVTVEYVTKHCRKITFQNENTQEFFSEYIYKRSDKELERDIHRWQVWVRLAEDEILKRRTELAKKYASQNIAHRSGNYPFNQGATAVTNKAMALSGLHPTSSVETTTTTKTVTKRKLRGSTVPQSYNMKQISVQLAAIAQLPPIEQAAELKRLKDLLATALAKGKSENGTT